MSYTEGAGSRLYSFGRVRIVSQSDLSSSESTIQVGSISKINHKIIRACRKCLLAILRGKGVRYSIFSLVMPFPVDI